MGKRWKGRDQEAQGNSREPFTARAPAQICPRPEEQMVPPQGCPGAYMKRGIVSVATGGQFIAASNVPAGEAQGFQGYEATAAHLIPGTREVQGSGFRAKTTCFSCHQLFGLVSTRTHSLNSPWGVWEVQITGKFRDLRHQGGKATGKGSLLRSVSWGWE